jgi:hypothetical protein
MDDIARAVSSAQARNEYLVDRSLHRCSGSRASRKMS